VNSTRLGLRASSIVVSLGLIAAAASSTMTACSSDAPKSGFGEKPDTGTPAEDAGKLIDIPPPDMEAGIGEACGGGEVLPTKVPVYFEFVADGSGSMSGNKWAGQVEALKAIAESIKKSTEVQIAAGELADTAVGLSVFSDTLDSTNGSGPYPGTTDIPIQAITDNTKMASYWSRVKGQPSDLTPTKEALEGAYKTLEDYVPQANVKTNGKRIVVLISDGEPTDDSPAGSIFALAAAKNAQAKSIFTYAIGVGSGTSYSPKFMADLAKAGKTAPMGCDAAKTTNPDCFYQIDPSGGKSSSTISAEMVAALETIRALASECDLTLTLLDNEGKPADPNKVEVTYIDEKGNETPIAKDAVDGWVYDNPTMPTRIILNGKACVQARSNAKGKTKVKLGCKPKDG
jgi:von Willebrand factor type A domain